MVFVFGYASLVAALDPAAVPGRLRGFRRRWGVAMNNWEGELGVKHFVDRASGERPHIRVAYLDIYEDAGGAVNGLALPVDRARLDALDAREVNYRRVDVTAAFDGDVGGRVFAYVGLEAARERCRLGIEDGDAFVSRGYVSEVRRAFAGLSPDALAEFDRTTDPLPFPERDLQLVQRNI